MAAPIAHIFLALKMLAGPLADSQFDSQAFIAGTSFPDIRYLKVIDREQTHIKNVELEQVKAEPNSFKAGMMFHSYVDEQRNRYIQDNKVIELLPKFKYISQCLKFAEDFILLQHFTPSDVIIAAFDKPYPEELGFGIAKSDIERWHKVMRVYLKTGLAKGIFATMLKTIKPNQLIQRTLINVLYQIKIKPMISNIANNPQVIAAIENFYLNFS